MKDKIEFRDHNFNPMDYDIRQDFMDMPPADPICFNMAKLAEPTLTYDEFARRWRENTRKLRNS